MGTEKNGVYRVNNGTDYDEVNLKTIAGQVIYTMKKDSAKITTQKIIDDIIDLNRDTMLQLKQLMKGDGSDETDTFQEFIKANDVIYIPKGFTIGLSKSIDISGSKKIISDGGTIKCLAKGLDNVFRATTGSDIVISGLKFDMAKLGRTSIDLNNVTGYLVENCSFTGYTAEHGWYQTDGGLRVNKCSDGIIAFNRWIDHGNQYGTATKTLNRCVGLGGGCDNTLVIGNTFKRVNQAIVTDSINIKIASNHFEDVQDNSIYCVSTSENIVIEGNTFKNALDECVVLSGIGGFTIDGNVFDEVKNKVIAINDDDLKNVSITDNVVKCTTAPANIIAWRNKTDVQEVIDATVTNFIVSGNTFEVTGATNNTLFYFGNINDGICEGNYFKINTTGGNTIRFNGKATLKWMFKDNIIENAGATGTSVTLLDFPGNPTTKDFILENCKINGGRFARTNGIVCRNMRYQAVSTTSVYLNGQMKNSVLWGGALPTAGEWAVGDIIYNNTPKSGSHIGWVCVEAGTPGTWKPFGKIE